MSVPWHSDFEHLFYYSGRTYSFVFQLFLFGSFYFNVFVSKLKGGCYTSANREFRCKQTQEHVSKGLYWSFFFFLFFFNINVDWHISCKAFVICNWWQKHCAVNQPVTCKYAAVGRMTTETYWFWIFPVLRCLIHSLILNLSLPFWAALFTSQLAIFTGGTLTDYIYCRKGCVIFSVSALENYIYYCNFASYVEV